MSNWGFESPEEWLQMLKLNNLLHIHVKNKNDPWYVLAPISQLLLGQKSKVRTVLKSWQRALFKTDLTFWIWWRFEVAIGKKQNSVLHPLVPFFQQSCILHISHHTSSPPSQPHRIITISHQVNQPTMCLSAIWSEFTTFKPFGLLKVK